jgi:non-homologous end joining protein Ku
MAAFAVICETIRSMNMVAIGTVVLTSREHIIAFEPLRHPYDSAFGENEGNSET